MEKILLEYTGTESVQTAYGNLPEKGELMLRVSLPDLETSLYALEEAGFCALYVAYPQTAGEKASISAYKGKLGRCFETGRNAIYKGVAQAVLDDDHHLLIADRELPVCEKTATVYGFPPYQKLVDCSPPLPDLLEMLETDPLIFQCNTFEDDMTTLYEMLRDAYPDEDRCLLYYPGPFRFLILDDGSVVRRGKVNNVPASQRKKLIQHEGFIDTDQRGLASTGFDGMTGKDREKVPGKLIFKDIYQESGSTYFIYSGSAKVAIDGSVNETINGTTTDTLYDTTAGMLTGGGKTDFSVLKDLKTGLKERMTGVIRDNRKYFILTGSDPDIAWGCCPSGEVAEAGLLVRAGILCSYAQPVSDDACPLATYAFKNEIKIGEDGLLFTIDKEFRKKVLHRLEGKSFNLPGNLLKWVLLAFVLASLAIAVYRVSDRTIIPSGISLYEQLSPVSQDQFMILLFHFRERCETCLNMENYTRDFIEAYNKEADQDSQIQFKLAVINDDRNLNLVRRFNLYTSTIVLVKFLNAKEEQVKVLSNAWQLYRDENAYKAMLGNEIETFILQLHG